MRRVIIGLFLIGGFFVSCKKKDLPISPGNLGDEKNNPEKILPYVSAYYTLEGIMNSGHLRDFNSGAQGIQDEIYIDFSEPMDESGLLGAISTRVIGGKGTSFPQGTWIYEKEQKRLRFVLNEGASFVDSTKYEVTITSEAKDLAGNPLDGNRNGVVEENLIRFIFSFIQMEVKMYRILIIILLFLMVYFRI